MGVEDKKFTTISKKVGGVTIERRRGQDTKVYSLFIRKTGRAMIEGQDKMRKFTTVYLRGKWGEFQ